MWPKFLHMLFTRPFSSGRPSIDRRRGRQRRCAPRIERLEDRHLLSGLAVSAGGPLADAGLSVATDDAGNVYVAGYTTGPSAFNAFSNPIQLPGLGGQDGFVARFAKGTGKCDWLVPLGGQYTDAATAVAVDHNGHVFVTGFFNGNGVGQGTSPAYFGQVVLPNAPLSLYGNTFVARLDADNGTVQWVTEADSAFAAGPGGLALDDAGNVYTVGGFINLVQFELDTDHVHPHFGPVIPSAIYNTNNAFLLKQDNNGNLIWAQRFGTSDGTNQGDGADGVCIAVNGTGTNIYVGGSFRAVYGAPVDFSTGTGGPSLPLKPSGFTDAFVEKFDGSGNSQWAVPGGGPGGVGQEGDRECVNGIALDSQGYPYVTGNYSNTGTFGNFQLPGILGANAFVAKIDPMGPSQPDKGYVNAVRFADDTGRELGTGIAIDQADNVYATGYFLVGTQVGPFQLTSRGSYDTYVARLDTDLNVLCANQLGGTGFDGANGIAVDHFGFFATTGAFTGSGQFSLPPGPVVTLTSTGDTDVFVSRQRLECHVHAMVMGGHVLQLVGDDTANRIALTDDAQGNITAMLDDDAPRMYHGIDQIVVMTLGGDDVFRYQGGSPTAVWNPDGRPADLTVDLGSGKNTFALDAYGPSRHLPSERPWRINVTTGENDDQVDLDVSGSVPLQIAASLGGGNDIANVTLANDTLDSSTATTIALDGGNGDDHLAVQVLSPVFLGAANLSVVALGGLGNDIVTVEGIDPTGDLYGNDRAHFNITASGGDGQDQIHVLVGSINQPPDPELRLDWNLVVTGDEGNDTIDVVARDVLLAAGLDRSMPVAFRLLADGGDGKDVVSANLFFDPRSNAMVDAQVLGGRGNDDLTLNLYGLDPDWISALIDGGAGHDTAHDTDNVRVINCEP
jgi:hypothetical protein